MARKKLSMRKVGEVARLKASGLSSRQIARSCRIARSTVADYLERLAGAGLGWPLPPEMNEAELDVRLFRRPEGRGARLRFAGEVAGFEQGLSVIIALPDLRRGKTGRELTTNATLILEGEGRFFSTATEGVCWTDVIRQEPLSGDRFTVSGKLYCIAPLVEVNGDASVSISELEFAGWLDWGAN